MSDRNREGGNKSARELVWAKDGLYEWGRQGDNVARRECVRE